MKTCGARTGISYFSSILLILVYAVTSALAQADTATITGAITDTGGAIVPGATVTFTSTDKGFTRSVQASGEGTYSIINIPPGIYSLEVVHQGFKKFVQSDIRALVGTTSTVNVSLQIGDVNEQVTVTSDSIDAIINSSDATIGNNFQPVQIEQLPTESR